MQILLLDVRKLVHSAWTQKALEPLDARLDERKKVVLVARDDTSPEADINVTLSLARVRLLAQVGDCSRRRDGVQRHVYHGCYAARSGSLSSCCEALPFRSPGLIEVDCETKARSVERRWSKVNVEAG